MISAALNCKMEKDHDAIISNFLEKHWVGQCEGIVVPGESCDSYSKQHVFCIALWFTGWGYLPLAQQMSPFKITEHLS